MSPLFIGLKYVSLKDVGLKDVGLKDVSLKDVMVLLMPKSRLCIPCIESSNIQNKFVVDTISCTT